MSGGSYDYAYSRLEEFADALQHEGGCYCASPSLRSLFEAHVRKVARAMYAIEWNDSGDGNEQETSLIMACLNITLDGRELPAKDAAGEIAKDKLRAIKELLEEKP